MIHFNRKNRCCLRGGERASKFRRFVFHDEWLDFELLLTKSKPTVYTKVFLMNQNSNSLQQQSVWKRILCNWWMSSHYRRKSRLEIPMTIEFHHWNLALIANRTWSSIMCAGRRRQMFVSRLVTLLSNWRVVRCFADPWRAVVMMEFFWWATL